MYKQVSHVELINFRKYLMEINPIDIIEFAKTILIGDSSRIYLLDFFNLFPNVSKEIFRKYRDFRDELIRRYPKKIDQITSPCRWTIELFHSEILNHVIQFNEYLKSMPEYHSMIFVCLDKILRADEEAKLKSTYMNSRFFYLNENSNKFFEYLQRKSLKTNHRNKSMNFYPLLFHTNSISTGLVFNYYYSYLNRQIESTNNIYFHLIIRGNYSEEYFPKNISVILNVLIEDEFLNNHPMIFDDDNLQLIQSKVLEFELMKSKFSNENEMIITYSMIGVKDFGLIVQTIEIYGNLYQCIENIISIKLEDDVRTWNEQYQSSNIPNCFEHQQDSRRKCYFFSIDQCPTESDGFNGVSTMKKTTKDCYELYKTDHENYFTSDGKKISEILVIPVYFLLFPLSCQFGPSDINETTQANPTILRGTIIDPFIPDRIRLAYVKHDVLRSAPMKQYNRYLRRTFYYFDHFNNNHQIIRYLFCGEYPNILSTLDQLEKIGRISSIEKHDGYHRFSNILQRLIQVNNHSESVQIIQYNDQIDQYDADLKSPCEQIKEYIDQWYHPSDDLLSNLSIQSKILPQNEISRILLFYRDNPSISTLINNLKNQLEINEIIFEDIHGNFNKIKENDQILFICTGGKYDKINRLIASHIENKIKKFGILRDVFILVNESIKHFPFYFIQSIPYLTFDLEKRSAILDKNDIQTIIFYLKNMNILSKSYQINFDDINSILKKSSLHCSSIGQGCGVAFYFNYMKTRLSSSDHHYRIELIEKQIKKECLNNRNYYFISQWIFLLPTFSENTNSILSSLCLQNNSKYKLEIWKSNDQNFQMPDLTITIGGIFQRSFSPLIIYKLINITNGKSFYFPMEIPAALHALEKQYNHVLSHFHFGKYNPRKQATAFQKIVQECFDNDKDQLVNEHVRFLSFDNSQTNEDFLQILWDNLSSFTQQNCL